jgi:hypothetical protein
MKALSRRSVPRAAATRDLVVAACVGVAMLATSPVVHAQGRPTSKIVEHGLYTGPADDPTLQTKTDRVPARVGVRFGFCAEITGLPTGDAKLAFTENVRHPLLTTDRGIEEIGWNVPRFVRVESGGRSRWCASHTFKEKWELVPGTWRFALSDNAGDIVLKEFQVVPDGQ